MPRPPKLDPEMSAADAAALANVLRRSLAGEDLDDRAVLAIARSLKRIRTDETTPHRDRLIRLLEGALASCLSKRSIESALRESISLIVFPLPRRKSA